MLEKEKQSKSKIDKRKKIIMARTNINETETNDLKVGSLRRSTKWINSWLNWWKKTQKSPVLRVQRRAITVDLTDIERIIREDCEQIYAKNEKIWM